MYFSERQENTVSIYSHFIMHVPTKKQKRAAEHPYLLSHRAVLKLDFIHNHPAHPLSFRHISGNTKQRFF